MNSSKQIAAEELLHDDFFTLFTREQLNQFIEYAYRRKYKKGQVLFTEGDPFDRMYYMLSGYVRLEKRDIHGVNSFYCYARENMFFPYVNMFQEALFHYTAIAANNIEILYISKVVLEEIFKDNKTILLRIAKKLEDLVLIREERLQYMLQQNARMRVVATISYLIKEVGRKEGDALFIDCPIAVRDIAEMSGTSRETASAVVSKLRSRNIIEYQGKAQILINDPGYFDPLPEINQLFFC